MLKSTRDLIVKPNNGFLYDFYHNFISGFANDFCGNFIGGLYYSIKDMTLNFFGY